MDHRDGQIELRNKLFMLLKERAFRRGKVVLASGRESDFYFDMKPAMLDPDGAALLAELILQELQGVEAECVGGLEMGAVPLIASVAMKSLDYGRHLQGFFVRKAVKDHGTKKRVDGADIAGKSVVILEDVTTTGGSAMEARMWRSYCRSWTGARGLPTSTRRLASPSNRCSAPRSFSPSFS
jgi:orotate phosphoribosyltransferase